jgi:hypothetical protein
LVSCKNLAFAQMYFESKSFKLLLVFAPRLKSRCLGLAG